MHGKRCALSPKDRKTCKCECGGRLHGSALRQSKVGRAVALAVTVTVAVTVGGLAVTGNFSASSNGGNDLSVQVDFDLNKAISALSSLGFGGRRISNLGTSGASHVTDCAKGTTRQVKKFLTRNRCKQYAANTWTITRQGGTAEVAFAWVEMPTASLAGQYKAVVDTYGTGNPPGVSSAFNGRCYASGQQDSTVWTVEVRPTGNLNFDRMVLQAAAQRKLSPDYLGIHCVI